MKPKLTAKRDLAGGEKTRYSKKLKLHDEVSLKYLDAYLDDLEAELQEMAPISISNEGPLDSKRSEELNEKEPKRQMSLEKFESKRKIRCNDYMIFCPEALQHISKESKPVEKYTWLGERMRMSFKMLRCDTKLVRTMMHSHGFIQCSNKNPMVNFIWTGSSMRPSKMRDLQPWQRLNQFPRSNQLTRKDLLYENLERSKSIFGDAFAFYPEYYVMPRGRPQLEKAIERLEAQIASGIEKSSFPGEFIVKPVNSCQGRGIFFIKQACQVPQDEPLLVSRYLSDPYLINGHKFDLRIYVAVTSFYPLVAYVYSEGLTRLASMPYDVMASSESNEFIHLTNYSINKNSTSFVRNESMSSEDLGHKWTLGALLRAMENEGKDAKLLMLRIEDLVVKSLLSIQNSVTAVSRTILRHVGTNFELFGFDVLVDANLKPWLLEVNLSPSLACDAPLDSLLKSRLIADLFNLACVPLIDRKVVDTFTHFKFLITPSSNADVDDDSDDVDLGEVRMLRRRPVGLKVRLLRDRGEGNRGKFEKLGSLERSMLNRRLVNGGSNGEQKFQVILRRVRQESKRRGDFIRVFPRPGTWNMYSGIMEDLGSEDFDQRLYEEDVMGQLRATREVSVEKKARRSSSCDENDLTGQIESDADLYHDVMIDAEKYPTMESVPMNVQQILEPWYHEAGGYTKKITQEGETYASRLPVVRQSSRHRTKSCTEFYENRREHLRNKKAAAELAAQPATSDKENSRPIDSPAADSALKPTSDVLTAAV